MVPSSINKLRNALLLSMIEKVTYSMTYTLANREPMGKIVIELAEDILPTTCKNFKLLCESKVSWVQLPWYKSISGALSDVSHCVLYSVREVKGQDQGTRGLSSAGSSRVSARGKSLS